jgi:hypothetical protein
MKAKLTKAFPIAGTVIMTLSASPKTGKTDKTSKVQRATLFDHTLYIQIINIVYLYSSSISSIRFWKKFRVVTLSEQSLDDVSNIKSPTRQKADCVTMSF